MTDLLADDVLYTSETVEVLFASEAGALLAETRIRFRAAPRPAARLIRGHDVIEMRSHLAALGIEHAESAMAPALMAA